MDSRNTASLKTKRRMTAVLLASGLSRRMGQNKLLLPVDGKPMIMHVMTLIEAFDFHEVLVVSGCEQILEMAGQYGYRQIFNDAPEIGQSHSVVLGVAASPDAEGWLFINGDMPKLKTDTVRRILDAADEISGNDRIIVPRYGKRPGQPVCFLGDFRRELLTLTGDQGGRQIIRRYPDQVIYLDIEDEEQGMDVDTPEDYEKCIKGSHGYE